jgi:hypothetical protein
MKHLKVFNCFGLWNLFLILISMLIFFTATSQQTRNLDTRVYQNIIKPNESVKIKTIENGKVQNTAFATLSDVKITDKRQVLTYNNEKILSIDSASYKKLKGALHFSGPAKNIKVIPEIHVDPNQGQDEPSVYQIMFTLEQPLQYNDTLKKFCGLMGFLLAINNGAIVPLTEPVNIEVASNEVSSINPDALKIDHLNIPSTKIALAADMVRDSAEIKVITVSNPNGYTTFLKVTPRLVISTNQTTLQGLGVEQVPVNVMFKGSSSSDSVTVKFSPLKGVVTPNSISVHYNTPATVYLRSDGLGNSNLSATTSIYPNSNLLIFKYTFPWLFLLAAIGGGLVGSVAKYLIVAKNNQSVLKPIAGGILIGIIGAVAYYGLGINLLGVSLSPALNALAVFALGGLCAYFGISLLKPGGN